MPIKNKEANREYQAKWYRNHRELHYQRIKERQRSIRRWLKEYKSTLSCLNCGENHPAALDFHHRNPSDKEWRVPQCITKGWSKRRILTEIDKCDILCANCHRKHHFDNGAVV